ncbi:MAG: hypothetical protein FRC54_07410 [bacterium LCO1.1]|uniref:Uncharacterized protein n=1 Tax=Candidatus Weimeria bifida TaxID=2599074 RepID=A0A6N7J185_9FIRM|nr:hypothetical protein [Candidatus Weimeria bifida]
MKSAEENKAKQDSENKDPHERTTTEAPKALLQRKKIDKTESPEAADKDVNSGTLKSMRHVHPHTYVIHRIFHC